MISLQHSLPLTRRQYKNAARRRVRIEVMVTGHASHPGVPATQGAVELTPQAYVRTDLPQSCFDVKAPAVSRRTLLAAAAAITVSAASAADALPDGTGIEILEDSKGVGSRGARRSDMLLFHYVGRLEANGQVFDSTRGGLTYRDGGPGVLRPAAIALGGGPVPGICQGLEQALTGMAIGSRRTVRVPAQLGFGSQTVLAPYAIVPANSSLVYEIELLRLSAVGPDQLTKGIAKCGAGGANQQAESCANIPYAEFL